MGLFDENDRRELREMFREFSEVLMNAMDEKIVASEGRMIAAMDEKIGTAITASEGRMIAAMDEKIGTAIAASEERMIAAMDEKIGTAITASEERMIAAMDEKNEDTRNQIMAYLESKLEPEIRLLAEGHETLLKTLAPKDRVDALESDVFLLKQVVRTMRNELEDLKKAQGTSPPEGPKVSLREPAPF